MNLIQRVNCVFGKHHRDRHRVTQGVKVVRSRCTGCGKLMIKDQLGWRIATAKEKQGV